MESLLECMGMNLEKQVGWLPVPGESIYNTFASEQKKQIWSYYASSILDD